MIALARESEYMSKDDKEKAEELVREDVDVREALEQTTGKKPDERQKVETRHKVWLGSYILLLFVLGVVYYLLRRKELAFAEDYIPLIQRLVVGFMAIDVVLIVKRAVKAFLVEPLSDAAARYNLNRVTNLLAFLAIAFIVLSILFANWYTAAVESRWSIGRVGSMPTRRTRI